MIFGDRSEILAEVEKRVAELKKSYPKAMAINPEDVRVIFIVKDDPEKYWKHAAA
jgi:formate dehydrogenase iron-sulfur subunit